MSPRRRPIYGRNGGVLLILAILLAASGLAKMAMGSGKSLATEIAAMAEGAGETGASCKADPNLAGVLHDLASREAELDDRERKLAATRTALEASRKMIDDRMTDLQGAEDRLSSMIDHVSTAAEDDLARLTAVYESMKPKDAAALFEQMTPEFAAGFLARMRPDAAAALLAGLKPETAHVVSVVLAGRNADLPRSPPQKN